MIPFDLADIATGVEYYDPHLDRWYSGVSMNEKRWAFPCVSTENVLFAIGGCIGLLPSNYVERFDPRVSGGRLRLNSYSSSISLNRKVCGLECLQ